MSVTPEVEANGFWNHFTGKKKWTIYCGSCGHAWREKVIIQEWCSAICPNCGEQNVWSAYEFARKYNERKGNFEA